MRTGSSSSSFLFLLFSFKGFFLLPEPPPLHLGKSIVATIIVTDTPFPTLIFLPSFLFLFNHPHCVTTMSPLHHRRIVVVPPPRHRCASATSPPKLSTNKFVSKKILNYRWILSYVRTDEFYLYKNSSVIQIWLENFLLFLLTDLLVIFFKIIDRFYRWILSYVSTDDFFVDKLNLYYRQISKFVSKICRLFKFTNEYTYVNNSNTFCSDWRIFKGWKKNISIIKG